MKSPSVTTLLVYQSNNFASNDAKTGERVLSRQCRKIQSPQLKGSRGFGGSLVEEATLDVETFPKVKYRPSLCNERAGKNCIFSHLLPDKQRAETVLVFLRG